MKFFSTSVAASTPYDSSQTNLDAPNVQDALDKLAEPLVGLQQTKAVVVGTQVIYQVFDTLCSQQGEVLSRVT